MQFQFHFPFYSCASRNGTSKSEANPFEEEEWDEGDGESVLVDNGEPGVPVKALYDYEGAESDELTFKQGINISAKSIFLRLIRSTILIDMSLKPYKI